MASNAATETALGTLHAKVAQVMTNALDQITVQQAAYELAVNEAIESGNSEAIPVSAPEANPALLSVAVRFLDANKITCVPEAGNIMGELEQRLAKKKERKLKAVGNVVQMYDEE